MRNPLNSTSWIRLSVAIVLAFTVVLRADAARASGLPGFTLVGEDWTYDPGDGGTLITGKLIQPTTGSAPHPAVLISHGQGGGASGFSAQKAAVMRTWGLVCIAPNYTHVDTSYPPGTDGWSTENERRARACLTILASRADVDMARVAAYGNSKGAFVTAGLCGATLPGEIRAAAITAGGTSGTTDTSLAAPATQEVQGISAPFLLLHGADDTTVSPNSSALLDALLSTNGIPHQRFVWSGVGHDLHAQRSNDVYALLRAWFSAHGVLGEGANTPPSVSALADVAVPVDTVVGPLAFTIGDAQSAASALVVSALSLDIGIVPPANIALAGSAANRSVQLTPAAGATGSATIVLVVDDGGLSSFSAFRAQFGGGAQHAFCAGDGLDPEVTSACPCSNLGGPGRGCAHSANPQGAQLSASGSTNPDALVLSMSGAPASVTCIFLQGDQRADVVYGDGIRCAGGALIRLRIRATVAGAAQFPVGAEPSVSVRGGVVPGSGAVRYYQTYFRNAAAAFCPPATFNVTNGWLVAW